MNALYPPPPDSVKDRSPLVNSSIYHPKKTSSSLGQECNNLEGQARVSRPPLMVSALDNLEVSLCLTTCNTDIFERLSFFKKELQNTVSCNSVAIGLDHQEEISFNLQRSGTRLYPYVLRSGDITLMLSSRSSDSSIPNCKIEIGSLSCQDDAFGMYSTLVSWLNHYGMKPVKEVVSRVDLATDISIDIKTLKVSDKNRWISRARKFSVFYENWDVTGVMLGKGNLACRIYDKSLELQSDKTKSEFFHKKWQCEEGTPITRCEFQVRREVLKEFDVSVNTVEELKNNIDAIWQYCVKDWLRQAESSVDRENDNQNRAINSIYWDQLQTAIFNLAQAGTKRVKKKLHKNLSALRVQARGCLLNFAAAAGHASDDYFGIMATIQNIIQDEFDDYMIKHQVDFEKLFKVRRNEVYTSF